MNSDAQKTKLESRRKPKQLLLLKNERSSYGGTLLNTRKGRARGRPLSTRSTMHLVLRSSLAKGEWSFRHSKNKRKVEGICAKFAAKNGVQILSLANVGNHLHFHIKLGNRHTYPRFIRAITSAIAMAMTGTSRWRQPLKNKKQALAGPRKTSASGGKKIRFWDYRPFSRIVHGLQDYLGVRDYVAVNQLEGAGTRRSIAYGIVKFSPPTREWSAQLRFSSG